MTPLFLEYSKFSPVPRPLKSSEFKKVENGSVGWHLSYTKSHQKVIHIINSDTEEGVQIPTHWVLQNT